MKKTTLFLTCILVCISFFSKAQDRQDEVRQKLQLSIDAQSDVLSHVTGWSKIENAEGKFWKQSDINEENSYLPRFNKYSGFKSLRIYKFSIEGSIFYVLNQVYTGGNHYFVFNESSFEQLKLDCRDVLLFPEVDNRRISIKYVGYQDKYQTVDFHAVYDDFNPELLLKDKEMIRVLLLGKGSSEYYEPIKDSLFIMNSQIIKGDTIVRFNFNTDASNITDDYFELKLSQFKKIFYFSPYKYLPTNYYSLVYAKCKDEFNNDRPSYKFPDGQGTCTWLDGTKYVGEFKNGEVCGHGTKTYINGDFEVGEFKNGLLNGTATRTNHDGSIFIGVFENNYMCGQGTYTWADGTKYVGEFLNDNFYGQGTQTWANGDKYIGKWLNSKRNAQGTITWANGNKYVGEWKNNQRIGQGTITWPDGNKYVGEWKNDQMTGQGTYSWANGDKYVGEFLNGQFNGQGTLTFVNGHKNVGKFKDDKYIGNIK